MELDYVIERGSPYGKGQADASQRASSKSSSSQPVMPPAMIFTGHPSSARPADAQGLSGASSGITYSQGPFAPAEHLATYLAAILGFLEIGDVQVVRAEGVAYASEQDEVAMKAAQERIGSLVAA